VTGFIKNIMEGKGKEINNKMIFFLYKKKLLPLLEYVNE